MKPVAIIFDWGDTIMRDFKFPGAMKNWEQVEWIPGAQEMLEQISALYICCIATSAEHSGKNDMIEALARVGADKYFHYFFSSSDLGYTKPDPAFYLEILKRINLQPEQCVAVGNLYIKDIIPARDAGMITVYFNENNESGDFTAADFVITKMTELPEVLDKIKKA